MPLSRVTVSVGLYVAVVLHEIAGGCERVFPNMEPIVTFIEGRDYALLHDEIRTILKAIAWRLECFPNVGCNPFILPAQPGDNNNNKEDSKGSKSKQGLLFSFRVGEPGPGEMEHIRGILKSCGVPSRFVHPCVVN